MKTIRGFFGSLYLIQFSILAFVLVVLVSFARADEVRPFQLPHLEGDMNGFEYRPLVEAMRQARGNLKTLLPPDGPQNGRIRKRANDPLDAILDLGKRNLEWLEAINKARPANAKLELSTAETQVAIPIDQPRSTNRATIQAAMADFKAKAVQRFSQVLFEAGALPSTTNGLSDDAFLDHARAFDRIYQSASRWLLQEPYLSQYASRKRDDIRGYYFLSRIQNVDRQLQAWPNLSNEDRARFSEWLIGVCANSGGSLDSCRDSLLKTIERERHPLSFYNRYIGAAKEKFLSYFRIQNARRDASWGAGGSLFTVPFLLPNADAVARWLKTNVEDEWRFQGFRLAIDFKNSGMSLTRVEFKAGATPHVNGLGGNTITMDANRSIDEYSSRWTIRHEYGHTLGFPDCYVEFYDSARAVMINYQIDTTNLMCSRRGHLLAVHVNELKRAYGGGARAKEDAPSRRPPVLFR